MRNRGIRAVGVVGAVVVVGLFVVLFAGQYSPPNQVTLQQVYDLLVTADGQNRLVVLETRLEELTKHVEDLDAEVDLVYQVALKMQDAQYGFFDTEKWTLDDIKYVLEAIGRQLDVIQAKTDTL